MCGVWYVICVGNQSARPPISCVCVCVADSLFCDRLVNTHGSEFILPKETLSSAGCRLARAGRRVGVTAGGAVLGDRGSLVRR